MQTADLEYHINVAKSNNCDVKEPVIVLFGWGGCSDNYLAKYSLIYEEHGCSTFRCIIRPKILFPGKCNKDKLDIAVQNIVSLLQKFEDHPLYFHSFSNGGCVIYNSVRKILQDSSNYRFQVKGCIFDSGPSKAYAPNIITAVTNAVRGNTITRYSYAVFVLSYVYAHAGFSWISSLARCKGPYSRRFELFESLAFEPNICPQLFLFSKFDDVCPCESVQEFVDIRRGRGVDVTTVIWEDSEHVKHLIKFRREYIDTVIKFISPHLSHLTIG